MPEGRDRLADPEVIRQEDEGQIVADWTRVCVVCMVDAGPRAVDDQRLRMHEQASKTHSGQREHHHDGQPREFFPEWQPRRGGDVMN